MNDVYTIERENTGGDRRIVRTIDTDALPQIVDRISYVRDAAEEVLRAPGVHRVHVFLDSGVEYRRQYTLTVGKAS